MNYLQRLERWSDVHPSKWLELLRIALGIFLCYKGVEFAQTSSLMSLMSGQVPFNSFILILVSHYILFAHIMGGFLIALGMLTRFACLIQIPILLGAIIFINLSPGALNQFSELSLSVLTLLLLIYFSIAGSGPWSFDWYLDREKKRKL